MRRTMQKARAAVGPLLTRASAAMVTGKAAKVDVDRRALRVLIIAALALVLVTPEFAMAAAASKPWDSLATSVLDMLTGGLTRTVAIIAVIACGFSALAGKMSWNWAINVGVGIVLIFGGAAIVDYLITAAS